MELTVQLLRYLCLQLGNMQLRFMHSVDLRSGFGLYWQQLWVCVELRLQLLRYLLLQLRHLQQLQHLRVIDLHSSFGMHWQ